jgi:hypothetical protein
MANPPVYSSGQVSVTSTVGGTLIASSGTSSSILVSNGSGAQVFLGGAGVTVATGLPVAASTTVTVPAAGGQNAALYGIVASTSSTVSFLYVT